MQERMAEIERLVKAHDDDVDPNIVLLDDMDNVGVTKTVEAEIFDYGKVELIAEVVVYHCQNCELSWSGVDGEDARQRAIDEHLANEGGDDGK